MNQEILNFAKKCPALTGSIATGKSTVAKIFKDLGGHVIDTDIIAREVVEPGQPGMNGLLHAFGNDVVYSDGTLNRESLRNIIINDSKKRKLLNSILHPHISSRVFDLLETHLANDDGMPVIIDVPLLFEAGWDKIFIKTIVVYVPVEIQVNRLMIRDRIDRVSAEKNVAAQVSIEDKKGKASIVIDNSGSLKNTADQSARVFEQLCREWKGKI